MSRTITALAAIAALAITASAAVGQDYPSKQITIVAPFPPGASTDGVARILQTKLSEALGAPVVVENRGGAGGNIGSATVARAAPDGYTLLLTVNAPIVMNPFMYKNFPYKPDQDFASIAMIGETYMALVVQDTSPIKSVADLIAEAKKTPRILTFGSAGVGSAHQLAGELLNKNAGIQVTHVPFQGGGPAVQNLLGGHLSMTYGTLPAVLPQIKAGKLRLIAFAEGKRVKEFPDTPTIAEIVPGVETSTWIGFFAPAKTPRAVIEKLAKATSEVMNSDDAKSKLTAIGVVPNLLGPDAMDKRVKDDLAFWGKAIPSIGIEAQ